METDSVPFEGKLNHIAVAVRDLDASVQIYRLLGLRVGEREVIEEQGVELQLLTAGDTRIELVQPLSDNSPVGKFISKRGEGLHHLAFDVDDIKDTLQQCEAKGIKGLSSEPKIGAEGNLILFLDPRTTGGVLIELVQKLSK